MPQLITLLLSLVIYLKVSAQKLLSEGAKLLFKNTSTTLTVEQKNQVYKRTGFALSKDKKQFAMSDEASAMEYPFDVTVLPTDINKDGKEEVFLVFGNSYTSGMTGSNVLLFIKDNAGNYQSNFGFSGTTPDIMPTKNLGYPDLLIGGPGFEFPIWKWNGKEYVFKKKISEANLAKIKTTNVEAASKTYTASIKQ